MTCRASTVSLNSKSNTGAGVICRLILLISCSMFPVLAQLVFEMVLFVLNGFWGYDWYIYDLNVLKGASLSINFGLSWCRPKHRNEWRKMTKHRCHQNWLRATQVMSRRYWRHPRVIPDTPGCSLWIKKQTLKQHIMLTCVCVVAFILSQDLLYESSRR